MPADITDLTLERALALWTQRHSGAPWTPADQAALLAWLDAAPGHRAAYERVARAWEAAGDLGGHIRRVPVAPRRRPAWLRPVAAACAALLLAAIAVPLARTGQQWWYGTPQAWSTGPGELRTLTLKDGTTVVLDAGSALTAQIGAGLRRVVLRRGEALFTVTHDTSRPFVVDAAGSQVRDLGTRFDVQILKGAARVGVQQGQVELATAQGRLVLSAGLAGGYDHNGALLPVGRADPSMMPGSQRHFDATPLPEVLELLGRHHGVIFVYPERSLEDLRVSGSFRIDDMPALLRTLGVALPIRTRAAGPDRIEVSRRPAGPGASGADRGARVP